MIIYKVFYKNYGLKKGEFMGAMIERRQDLRGKSLVESGLKLAKLTFGRMLKDKNAIFVVPIELNLKNNPVVPVEKIVFTKEEFWEMMKGADQEIKSKGDAGVLSTVSSDI